MLQPTITEKAAFTVVGYEAPFIHALSPDATNFTVIGPLWDKLLHRADDIPNRLGAEMYGIIYSLPEAERTHPHELQYIAAVPVSSKSDIPDGMVSREIAAGTFAVFIHRGPIDTIGDTVYDIYRV